MLLLARNRTAPMASKSPRLSWRGATAERSGKSPEVEAAAVARSLCEAARDGSVVVYVTSQILYEFYSIVTNARRVAKPQAPADALKALGDLLTFLHVLCRSLRRRRKDLCSYCSVTPYPAATCSICRL